MIYRLLIYRIFALAMFAVMAGCTSQAVKDLSAQAKTNNEKMVSRYSEIVTAFTTQLGNEEQVARKLGGVLSEECRRTNLYTERQLSAQKEAIRYRLREHFYEAAMELEAQKYAEKFNSVHAALFDEAERRNAEVQRLQAIATGNSQDLEAAKKVLEEKLVVVGISDKISKNDLAAREKLKEKIVESRDSFFQEVDSGLAQVSFPAKTDCDPLNGSTEAVADQLATLKQALVEEAALLQALGASQSSSLKTIADNLNSPPFYKLVIAGAAEEVSAKLAALKEKAVTAANMLATSFEGYVDKIEISAQERVESVLEKLDEKEATLNDKLSSEMMKLESKLVSSFTQES